VKGELCAATNEVSLVDELERAERVCSDHPCECCWDHGGGDGGVMHAFLSAVSRRDQ